VKQAVESGFDSEEPERFQYKQSRAESDGAPPGFVVRGASLSGGLSSTQGERDWRLTLEVFPALSGPARRKTKAPFV